MKQRKSARKGIAIAVVMLLMVVLVTMLEVVIMLATSRSGNARTHFERLGADEAARAAVADALHEIETRVDWTEGFEAKPLSDVEASYSIDFSSSAPVRYRSVNNLLGPTAVDGPRGVGTVPAYTADLVVTVHFGSSERRVEVLVAPGDVTTNISPFALQSSGKIRMRGQVAIDGIDTLESSSPTEAGIYSGSSEAGVPQISWEGVEDTDRAEIAGKVSTSSADPTAVDFGSDSSRYNITGGIETAAAQVELPAVDIMATISSNSAHPAPTFQNFATTRLEGQKYTVAGDIVINGDLELQDSALYVNGSLTVNGAISGDGAIYVAGETHFQGDSKVMTSNEDGVALFSEGSVQLTGFKGNEFLDELAATDPQVQQYWTPIKSTLSDMKGLTSTNSPRNLLQYHRNKLEGMQRVLGEDLGINLPTWQGRQPDCIHKLMGRLESCPQSSTRDFLLKKFGEVRDVFADAHTPAMGDKAISDYVNGRGQKGIFEAVLDAYGDSNGGGGHHGSGGGYTLESIMAKMVTYVDQINYDKVGSSYFQGVVYTKGYVYAANEVSVVGALIAKGDANGAATTVNGVELKPGDVFLDDGVRLTMVNEYLKGLSPELPSVSPRVLSWMDL